MYDIPAVRSVVPETNTISKHRAMKFNVHYVDPAFNDVYLPPGIGGTLPTLAKLYMRHVTQNFKLIHVKPKPPQNSRQLGNLSHNPIGRRLCLLYLRKP